MFFVTGVELLLSRRLKVTAFNLDRNHTVLKCSNACVKEALKSDK